MLLDQFSGRHVLMLQGPNGPFFHKIAKALRQRGATVTKINLSAADLLFFFEPEALSYRGRLDDFGAFVDRVAEEKGADCVMVFGDTRPYHRRAIHVAKERGMDVFVFEEGYLRPDFVTLEKGGVNGNSTLPRDPAFYRQLKTEPLPEAHPVGNTYWWSAWWVLLNSLAITFLWFLFPRYRHHRDVNFFRQAFLWLRGGVRKFLRVGRDRGMTERFEGELSGKYFFVPLQVAGDSQIGHSHFASVADFLELVLRSFASEAPEDVLLVVKDHPMGRAYSNYGPMIRRIGAMLGVSDRVIHVDTVHLPTVLKHARGTIVINSTVGLSSVFHGTPTKCLGKATYDMTGLTHQGPLSKFWREPGKVDVRLYHKFQWHVRTTTQIEGSVWTEIWGVTDEPEAPRAVEPSDGGELVPESERVAVKG